MRKLSVNSGMSRPSKTVIQAKRVTPPAVPEIYRHSGSSFGSAGYGSSEDAGGFLINVPDTPKSLCDDHSDYGSNVSKSPGIGIINNFIASSTAVSSSTTSSSSSSSSSTMATTNTNQTFIFPVTREPLTHKAAVYYHQQLALNEDQGIDLTQSPGRDSPGSSSGSAGSGSRHSTASLDSGRASSYHTQTSLSSTRGVGSNGGSGSTSSGGGGGTLSSPRCSVSSCSIGSVDRMNQRTDHEVIADWLRELCLEEYTKLFIAAGYDMPTICRMTPEDLTAIGIKKPHHRERIKQHIDGLQLPDNLPNNVPGSIEEWLRLLRLDEYVQSLLAQGYTSVRDVIQLPWEDMEDIGIVKLGHQKKLLLAIKRVNDIVNGKWVPIQQQQQQHQQLVDGQMYHNHHHHQQQLHQHYQTNIMAQQQQQQQLQQYVAWEQRHTSGQSVYSDTDSNGIVLIQLRQARGKSLESLEDPNERIGGNNVGGGATNNGNQLTFVRPSTDIYYTTTGGVSGNNSGGAGFGVVQYQTNFQQPQPWRRSYDDGDITPTNEICISGCCGNESLLQQQQHYHHYHNQQQSPQQHYHHHHQQFQQQQQGGTLPRHHRGSMPRQRPIAKVLANVPLMASNSGSNCGDIDYVNESVIIPSKSYGMHSIRPNIVIGSNGNSSSNNNCSNISGNSNISNCSSSSSSSSSNSSNNSNGGNNSSNPKKQPPEPPRRQCSTGSIGSGSCIEQQQQISEHLESISLTYSPHHLSQLSQQTLLSQQQHQHQLSSTLPQQEQQQQQQQQQQLQQYIRHNLPSSSSSSTTSSPSLYSHHNNYAGQTHQTTVEIHAENVNDSKSNSSIDSIDALPFANDNAGTIKQRALNRQDILQTLSLSSSSSSSSSLATTVANIDQSSLIMLHKNGGATTTPSPTLSTTNPDATTSTAATIDSNVLNDIGNMLANLTDELDAMLEEEKRAGLNDSE